MEQPKGGNKKSKFVTNLAYILIAFFGYSTTATLAQSIIFFFRPPIELLRMISTTTNIDILEFMPPAFIYVMEHIHLFLSVSFVFSLISLISSFAFLKRRNWARIFFVVFMIVTIVFSFSGFLFHDAFMVEIPADEVLREIVESMNKLIDISLIALVVIIALFHTWLAYKLLSNSVRDEFVVSSLLDSKASKK